MRHRAMVVIGLVAVLVVSLAPTARPQGPPIKVALVAAMSGGSALSGGISGMSLRNGG